MFVDRYPPGRQQSAIIPLLDLAQRQVGAETQTQGWLPIPVIEYVAAYSRHALHPRLRGRDLLHDVQPRPGRPLPCPGLRHHALHAARLGRRARRLLREGHEEGADDRGRPVHAHRGRVPRRLRQRADGPDQRRQLRGSDLRDDDRDPRGAGPGRDAEAGAAGRAADQLSRGRPDHSPGDGRATITIIGGIGEGLGAFFSSLPAACQNQPAGRRPMPSRRRTPSRRRRATISLVAEDSGPQPARQRAGPELRRTPSPVATTASPIVCGRLTRAGRSERYIVVDGRGAWIESEMRPARWTAPSHEFCRAGARRLQGRPS